MLALLLLTAGGLVVRIRRRRRRHARSSLVVLPRRASSARTHALPIKLGQVATSTASAWQDSADVTRIQLPLSPKTPRAPPPRSLNYMDPKSSPKSHPGRHSCRASNSDPTPNDTLRSQDTTASTCIWRTSTGIDTPAAVRWIWGYHPAPYFCCHRLCRPWCSRRSSALRQ